MTERSPLTHALSDRYEIEREVGAGGMATVYLARDIKHARQVALKVLHPDLAAALGPERFLAEIRTTANLQHPQFSRCTIPVMPTGSSSMVMPLTNMRASSRVVSIRFTPLFRDRPRSRCERNTASSARPLNEPAAQHGRTSIFRTRAACGSA